MPTNGFNPATDRFTADLIRRKAWNLVGHAGFTLQDVEDLAQELRLHLLQRSPAFDPQVAHRNVFVTTVLERFSKNLVRHQHAEKRDYRRRHSLNVPVLEEAEPPTDGSQCVDQHQQDVRFGRQHRTDEELAQLTSDVALVMARLPEPLRELAERRKTKSMQEIADETGVPRTTLNDRMAKIRDWLIRHDIDEYF